MQRQAQDWLGQTLSKNNFVSRMNSDRFDLAHAHTERQSQYERGRTIIRTISFKINGILNAALWVNVDSSSVRLLALVRSYRLILASNRLLLFGQAWVRVGVLLAALFIINFATVSSVRADQFKIEARVDETVGRVRMTASNFPKEQDGTPWKVVVTRTPNGLSLVTSTASSCSSSSLPTVGDGFVVQDGVSYCDLGTAASSSNSPNIYTYNATATSQKSPTQGQTMGPVNATVTFSSGGTGSSYRPLFGTNTSLSAFINNFVSWVAYRVGPSVVGLLIIYAGFLYITSHGNEQQIKTAKEWIAGAILGFILLILIGAIMRGFFYV